MEELFNSEDSNSPDLQKERVELNNAFASMFENKKFSDVTFVLNDRKILAHKNVLSARYEYFDSLFSNLGEKNQEEIKIDGIAPDVFEIILEYVYKGRLTDWKAKMEQHAIALIKAADMLGIDGLRNKCEKFFIRERKINAETCCGFFMLADSHNAPQLKQIASDFIYTNLEEVKKTEGYKDIKRYRTTPAAVYESLSPSKRPRLLD